MIQTQCKQCWLFAKVIYQTFPLLKKKIKNASLWHWTTWENIFKFLLMLHFLVLWLPILESALDHNDFRIFQCGICGTWLCFPIEQFVYLVSCLQQRNYPLKETWVSYQVFLYSCLKNRAKVFPFHYLLCLNVIILS